MIAPIPGAFINRTNAPLTRPTIGEPKMPRAMSTKLPTAENPLLGSRGGELARDVLVADHCDSRRGGAHRRSHHRRAEQRAAFLELMVGARDRRRPRRHRCRAGRASANIRVDVSPPRRAASA